MKLVSIVFAAIAFCMVACDKEKDPTIYNGPDVVEFLTPITRSITTAATPKNDSILVQLVGPLRTSATKVNFEVDASSTAVANTDYTILTPTVEIPAGALSTWIKFRFSKVSAAKTLKINLTGADNAKPSENYKSFTYSLK